MSMKLFTSGRFIFHKPKQKQKQLFIIYAFVTITTCEFCLNCQYYWNKVLVQGAISVTTKPCRFTQISQKMKESDVVGNIKINLEIL